MKPMMIAAAAICFAGAPTWAQTTEDLCRQAFERTAEVRAELGLQRGTLPTEPGWTRESCRFVLEMPREDIAALITTMREACLREPAGCPETLRAAK